MKFPFPVRLSFAIIIVYAVYACCNLAKTLVHLSDEVNGEHSAGLAVMPALRQRLPPTFDALRGTPNKIQHEGKFGMGHRLNRLSAAHDLGSEMHLQVEANWKDCDMDLFPYLFRSKTLYPYQENESTHTGEGKIILIRNDVHGYYPAQSYKNAREVVSDSTRLRWQQKLDHDRFFFRHLQASFAFAEEQAQFKEYHRWYDSHIYGVHLRFGNGETDHFVEASRSIKTSPPEFLDNLAHLIHTHDKQRLEAASAKAKVKPAVVFVATDTGSAIQDLRGRLEPFGISVFQFDQDRLKSGQGVSYQAWKEGNICQVGWRDAAMDMMLLSQVDTLVATTRSTFTQILPRALVLGDSKEFCEGNPDSTAMDCTNDEEAWLYRNDASRIKSIRLGDRDNISSIVHKVMLHLPDLKHTRRKQEALKFLNDGHKLSGKELVFYYGPRINTEYREFRNFTTVWSF